MRVTGMAYVVANVNLSRQEQLLSYQRLLKGGPGSMGNSNLVLRAFSLAWERGGKRPWLTRSRE